MILQLRKSANYINRTMRRILLTSKDQFVTSREYLSIINTKKVDLELGYPKNPGKLKSNMLKCMSEKTRNKIVNSGNKNQAHHIVGIKTPLATKKLERFKIDINDPMNGILLPQNEESGLKGTIHRGGHNQDYYNYIENLFLNCNSKQDCYDVLDKMKNDLYNGKIQLYNTHKANSTFTNKIAS